MNIGIIDIGWKQLSIDSLKKDALGGSESWLMQVSNEFSKNHNVDVFCSTKEEKTEGNLHFIPLYSIIRYFNTKHPKYDFVILNRIVHRFNTDFIGLIRQYNATSNIYIQMHDLSMLFEDHLIEPYEMSQTCINDPRVRGFVFLTPWHARNFYAQYPQLSHIEHSIIPNGVDQSLISKDKKLKDHRVLWSSCAERGLDILINDVYPLVKERIPDFGVDVAGYNDLSSINVQDKDVKVLGNLDKKTLYKEMRKHCCWFYPGTFAETFCITMVENMLSENIVVSPFTYGTQHIVENDLKFMCMNNTFLNKDSREYGEACQEAADKIVDAILNYDKYKKEIKTVREYCERYTWSNTVSRYITTYNVDTYHCYPIKKELKGVFLSQSCNVDFFKRESELVEQTWAKELLEGKHPDYAYFRYTSCDESHPEPCIDGHIIYVNNDDTLPHTYEKMRDAYRVLLANGYKFNSIFRTNTSTFINVPKAIELMDNINPNEIISDVCGYYHLLSNGELKFQFNTFTGNAYIIADNIANKIFTSNYDSDIDNIPDGDDIITRHIINEIFDTNEIAYKPLNKEENGEAIDCKRYKFTDPKTDPDKDHVRRYIDDPNAVNKYTVISYRMIDLDLDERVKGGEFEHLQELYEAYILPDRASIINRLIKDNGYKTYLEIGLNNGDNFKLIDCESKESCDPFIINNVSNMLDDSNLVDENGELREDIVKMLTYRMTSDEMFEKNDKKYDIIFIDGLHERHQVLRDIKNSLSHLNKGGTIVAHDCLPLEELHQAVPRKSRAWNGDVWKVLPYLKSKGIEFKVVDIDSGCGIIPYTDKEIPVEEFDYNYRDYFNDKRNTKLNVITPHQFLIDSYKKERLN